MRDLLSACPSPPDFAFDWEALLHEHAFLRALADCPQDPEHHGEGDVATHTRMVCEALLALPAYAALPSTDQAVLFAAAVLHDVAKPCCTVLAGGRLRAPHHAPRGAVMARAILWRMGVPFGLREQVTALVQHHQVPFYCIDQPDPRRSAITVSETARCDLLALLAEADARGRISSQKARILDQVALFTELCVQHGYLNGPHPFASDHSRFVYYRTPGRDPDYAAHDDTTCEVTVMSGLPGAGKSHYARTRLGHLPQISLDDLRHELDVSPTAPQGPVLERARQLAREHLRRGESFVWNATNLSRQLRSTAIDLMAAYNARVRIIYVEAPSAVQSRQNQQRPHAVPAAIIERLLDRWQVPDRTEAHAVDHALHAP